MQGKIGEGEWLGDIKTCIKCGVTLSIYRGLHGPRWAVELMDQAQNQDEPTKSN